MRLRTLVKDIAVAGLSLTGLLYLIRGSSRRAVSSSNTETEVSSAVVADVDAAIKRVEDDAARDRFPAPEDKARTASNEYKDLVGEEHEIKKVLRQQS